MSKEKDGRQRAVIESVSPEIDGGRFPAKAIAGDPITVEADIFSDGHDLLAAELRWRPVGEGSWMAVPMQPGANDRWRARFTVAQPGDVEFTLSAWVDHFRTWQRDMRKRVEAGQDSEVDYQIGALLLQDAATRATGGDADWLARAASDLRVLALDPALTAMMARYPDRRFETEYDRTLRIAVDRVRARFSTWYEFFPRSAGTLRDSVARLEYAASMGFDVIYLPPIHPVGTTFRKGRNNTLTPGTADVGSPWAIGGPEGGHTAIHPDLGTLADFRALVQRAEDLGVEIALDVAFQASPDHPWAKDHPEWFKQRPDGTIQYAENPPKKYQDIYPFDFESEAWESMWRELKSVFDFWILEGVRIFRVDNPHTKAFPFWEWCLQEIRREHPDVLFLSEAFTRPKVKYRLAKCGFSQSYTYFPWRHAKHEIIDYFTELTKPPVSDYFRGNHWPNTPDILTEFLQTTGRPGFVQRLLLVSTLAANYGIYGPAFELQESRPLRPESEEYLDSEKYQVRHWDIEREDSLRDLITLVNRIRRSNPALQNDRSLRFHEIDDDQLLAYSKQSEDGSNLIVTVVTLDVRNKRSGWLTLPLEEMHIDPMAPYQVHELLTGARYIWRGPRNFVELDPTSAPAHIFAVRRRLRTEREFEYFL